MRTAKFIKEITVVDTDTNNDVQLSVYKHENGGMFAIDSSYLDQCTDDDENPVIPNPFGDKFDAGETGTDNVVMLVD